jgi:lysophospholipase L1-like esterase
MKTRRSRRALSCEALEDRLCQSGLSVIPDASEPIPRYDTLAEARHLECLAAVESGQASNVVFLGDSITQYFQSGAGAPIWSRRIAGMGAADFGVAGDTTNNLLWRVQNGELDGKPRLVVLTIGTNNINPNIGESVDQTVAGIVAVIRGIQLVSPKTQILLNGIFPRGETTDPIRLEIGAINGQLQTIAPSLNVHFVNPGAGLLSPRGSVTQSTLDLVHPNMLGYMRWAGGLMRPMRTMLNTSTG